MYLAIVKPENEDVCRCEVQPLLDFFRVPPDPVKVRLVEQDSAPVGPSAWIIHQRIRLAISLERIVQPVIAAFEVLLFPVYRINGL